MDTKMKSMISDVDHGDRVTALESGFSGLEDSMDQHRNDFKSRIVMLDSCRLIFGKSHFEKSKNRFCRTDF